MSTRTDLYETLAEAFAGLGSGAAEKPLARRELFDAAAQAFAQLATVEDETIDTSQFAVVGHTHDERYYTKTQVDDLVDGIVIPDHDHDTRYYTETEIDSFLAGKADSSHEHDASDITSGTMDVDRLGSGATGAGTKVLFDDNTWDTPSGGSGGPAAGDYWTTRRAFLAFYKKTTSTFDTIGIANTSNGTISTPAVADTDQTTRTVRLRFTGTTAAGQVVGPRVNEALLLTKVGFRFRAIVGQESNINGGRAFFGFTSLASPMGTSQPDALTDCLGVGYDPTDSSGGNWSFYHNDSAGSPSKIDTGLARSSSQLMLISLESDDGTSVDVSIIDWETGTEVYSATISSELPTTTTALRIVFQVRNEAAGGTAPILAFVNSYCEHGPEV